MSARSDRERGESGPYRSDDEALFDNFFKNDIRRDNSFPGRQPRSAFRNRSKFEDPRPSSSGRFAEHLRNFSPSAKESGEDIINRLKNQLRKESDMFFHSNPECDYDMHSKRADDSDDWIHKGLDDMRARHPMFRMPNWMSEDDDVSNLTSRMSQSPHFSTMGRRGAPWRERRNSGGSAMSGTSEEDSVDGHHSDKSSHSSGAPTAVRIPIRIEAEAPPGYEPVQSQHHQPHHQQQQQEPPQQHVHQEQPQQQQHPQQEQNVQQSPNEPQLCMGHLRKQPHYASRTAPAVDSINQEEVSRNTRCASAPPDMTDPLHGHKFVSKTTIIPQNPNEKPLSASPLFNNVAKPFVSSHKTQETTPPIAEEQLGDSLNGTQNEQSIQQYPEQNIQKEQYPQQQHFLQQQHPQQQQQHPQQPPYQQYPHQHQHSQQPYQQQQQQPQQQWENTGHKSSVIRNIPIILEGSHKRSTKEPSAPGRSPPQQQTQSRPHWERPLHNSHFGFGPSHGFPSEDPFFGFPSGSHPTPAHQHQQPQNQQPQQQFYQQPQPQPQHYHPQQSEPQPQPQYYQPSPQQPQPQQKEVTPPPPEPKDIKMDKIASVREFVTELQECVKNFESNEKNKEFLYLDEMLTRALLQLDDIDPDGKDDVRQARRTLIKDVNNTISTLEKKVTQHKENKHPETTNTEKSEKPDLLVQEESSFAKTQGDDKPKEDPSQTEMMETVDTNKPTEEIKVQETAVANSISTEPKKNSVQQKDSEEMDNVDSEKIETEKMDQEKTDPAKEGPEKIDPAKEGSEKIDPAKEGSEKLDPAKESSEKIDPAKEGSEKIGPAKEGSENKKNSEKIEIDSVSGEAEAMKEDCKGETSEANALVT